MRATLLPAAALVLTALIPWTGEFSASTALVVLAFVAPTCGWWIGGRGPSVARERTAAPLGRALVLLLLCGLGLSVLRRPVQVSWISGLAAVAGLLAIGLALRALSDRIGGPGARPGAVGLLALSGFAVALPLGFGVQGLVWAEEAPMLASRLLDLSPWTFVMESAGFDWMRDSRVYDPAGTEWFSDTRRPYPVLDGSESAWSAAGLKSLAAPGLVVVGCATSFILGRHRPAGTE